MNIGVCWRLLNDRVGADFFVQKVLVLKNNARVAEADTLAVSFLVEGDVDQVHLRLTILIWDNSFTSLPPPPSSSLNLHHHCRQCYLLIKNIIQASHHLDHLLHKQWGKTPLDHRSSSPKSPPVPPRSSTPTISYHLAYYQNNWKLMQYVVNSETSICSSEFVVCSMRVSARALPRKVLLSSTLCGPKPANKVQLITVELMTCIGQERRVRNGSYELRAQYFATENVQKE